MWEEYKLIDVTSAFVGITTPLPEIINVIQQAGWELENIGFKGDSYSASAKNAYGEKAEATGNTEGTAAGNLLASIQRQNAFRMPFNNKVAAWSDPFTDLQEAISHEYADAKMYDKKAAGGWSELAEDCRRRVEIIQNEINIEITDNPIPYKSFSEMAEDIMDKGHFTVSRANASHPIWSINQVVDFRIAHDILGHAASGGDWSWFGINRAFQAHAPLLSYTAQKALFTEVLGQGAFNAYYGSVAPQKISFLNIFDNPEDGKNPFHHPVHPSQTVVPGKTPSITREMDKIGSVDDTYLDPNHDYSSGIEPQDGNAYNWHRIKNADGQMVDPLNSRGLQDIIHGIKSNWHQHDGNTQEQAVRNAFANVLLKPGKTERAHAQHYQAINHLPGSASDPSLYWDALTRARDEHNNARGYLQANKEFDAYDMPLRRHVQSVNPDLNHDEISSLANDTLLNMRVEEEKEAKKKLGPEATSDDIHREATKRLLKRLKKITNAKLNQDYDFGNERMFFESKHPDSAIYPSPLAHHIKPIADISSNIKDVTESALSDINQGGKGHHFRSKILKQFSDIEPAQIDEVWSYLAPETNQLGAITDDILKALGHKKDNSNTRDYFKAERELHAARDASGYGHMPLGQFSKGLKNAMRHIPGHHPSKTHLHPISPSDHNHIDWGSRPKKSEKPKVPGWFNNTKDARKQVSKDWDRAEAIQHPKGAIPFKKAGSDTSNVFTPYYHHPDTNKRVDGKPGQSAMQHIRDSMNLSTPEIWALNPEIGKEVMPSGN